MKLPEFMTKNADNPASTPKTGVPSGECMEIEVAYALPERQSLVQLEVAEGCTARQAAELSGLDLLYPQLDLQTNPLGVFGEAVEDSYRLQAGDRVELYRPLLADPMEQRRQRASSS